MSKMPSEDAITSEEMTVIAPTASPSCNAFTALMSSKRKASPSSSEPAKKTYSKNAVFGRDGLGEYIKHPEKFEIKRVIYYDDDFVAINDLYPKSSVHTLLLPRSAKHALQDPFDAFEDVEFLAAVKLQVTKLHGIVAKELQRKFSKFSKQDTPYQAVLKGEVELTDDEPMPKGRDWDKEVKVGVHARPSMNHLHIHVLSVDRFSECMKHRKHYNSFATDFFIPIEDFPLAKDDPRRHPGKAGYLDEEMKCWRCGKNFGNKFAKLKEHLADEFDAWKKE